MKRQIGQRLPSGSFQIHENALENLQVFKYHLILKPTEQFQITMENYQNEHQSYLITVPVGLNSFEATLCSEIIKFMLLFCMSVTFELQPEYKTLISNFLSHFNLRAVWKKGPNYYKAVMNEPCFVSHLDFEDMAGGRATQTISNISQSSQQTHYHHKYYKQKNAYNYCVHIFNRDLIHSVMGNDNVEEMYEGCISELQQLYNQLKCGDRLASMGRVREYSFRRLKEYVDEKLTNEDDYFEGECDDGFDSVMKQALEEVFYEQYSIIKQKHGDGLQFNSLISIYERLLTTLTTTIKMDRKSITIVELTFKQFISDISHLWAKKSSNKSEQVYTQYNYNRKLRKWRISMQQYQRRQKEEKERLFRIIKQKEMAIVDLEKKCREMGRELIMEGKDGSNAGRQCLKQTQQRDLEQSKQILYLSQKMQQLKRQQLFPINQQLSESGKVAVNKGIKQRNTGNVDNSNVNASSTNINKKAQKPKEKALKQVGKIEHKSSKSCLLKFSSQKSLLRGPVNNSSKDGAICSKNHEAEKKRKGPQVSRSEVKENIEKKERSQKIPVI